jgi:DNA-binding MarR family transcriptional regulator
MRDPMKSIRAQWRQCCPELDTSSMEIAGRILLAASLLQTRLETVFRRHGVSSGGFDVLATLRRQGPPFELSPTMLYKELLITSGTMTHRLNTLENQGLIERVTHPSDRRGLLVRLTKKGLTVTNKLVKAHLENERGLFASMPGKDANALAKILGNWIESLDSD